MTPNTWTMPTSEPLQKVLRGLVNAGHEAYLVGGAVRDTLLLKPIKDYDVATSAMPDQVISLFDYVIPTGIAHGTVTVMVEDVPIEVTTFRIDGDYTDGRRPDGVRFGASIIEDLSRRDFTINAIAMDIHGQLYDPFNGVADLANKLLAPVGDAALRLREDKLRKLRAFRFQSQLGFALCPSLKSALQSSPNLDGISAERIKAEMDKLLMGANVTVALRSMADLGVLSCVAPEVDGLVDFAQGHPAHLFDAFTHTLAVVDAIEQAVNRVTRADILKSTIDDASMLVLKWAALFHDTGKPLTRTIDEVGVSHYYNHQEQSIRCFNEMALRLKFPNRQAEGIVALIDLHMLRPVSESKPIRRWMNRVVSTLPPMENSQAIASMLVFLMADAIGTGTLSDFDYHDSIISLVGEQLVQKVPMGRSALKVNGHQLMAACSELKKDPRQLKKLLEFLVSHCLEQPEDNEMQRLVDLSMDWLISQKTV